MMTDEAQPPTSSSSDANLPPPEPDPPPNIARMSSPSPSQGSQVRLSRSRAHSSGTSEDNQSSSSPNSSSTPACIKWSRGLSSLLDDQQGRDLFERYLEQEGCSAQLNFLWACEGLKCTATEDPPKIPQLVRSIHRHFFQNISLLGISDTTRSDLALRIAQAIIKEGRFNEVDLFDKAEEEVQTHMQDNLYPNFLKSDIYLCALSGEEESSNLQEQLECPLPDSSPTGRKSSTGDSGSFGGAEEARPSLTTALEVDVEDRSYNNSGGGQSPKIPSPPLPASSGVLLPSSLQTVHEDKELSVNAQQGCPKTVLALSKKALEKTEKSRAKIPGPPVATGQEFRREGFMSHFQHKPCNPATGAPLHPYHASYSEYNPVSRVDSEVQSMSSGAMTEDGTHGGGHSSSARRHGASASGHRSKGHGGSSCSAAHPHHHAQHSDPSGRRNPCPVMNPQIRDTLPMVAVGNTRQNPQKPGADIDPKVFARILTEKLNAVKRDRESRDRLNHKLNDDDDQVVVPNITGTVGGAEQNLIAIAINRIKDPPELPDDHILDQHMSRVFDKTPVNRSPKLRSPTSGRRRGGPPIMAIGRARRERDVISTVSGDSGNVHDMYPPCPNALPMTKSRSIPNELTTMRLHEYGDFSGAGASQRSHRFGGRSDPRHPHLPHMTRKASSEFIDSGISLVSGITSRQPPNQPTPLLPCDRTDLRVAQWIVHDSCADDRALPRSTFSPPSMRRPRKPPVLQHAPTSAYVPPGVDEVCKKLGKKPLPPTPFPSQAQVPLGPMSSSMSASASHHFPTPDEPSQKNVLVSSFVFYEDMQETPYGVKIPCKMFSDGRPYVTLAVFKEHLPKRGNYRCFFKRECDEVHTKVVQEEITDDFQELPLFEGKIIAHLKTVGPTQGSSGAFSLEKH